MERWALWLPAPSFTGNLREVAYSGTSTSSCEPEIIVPVPPSTEVGLTITSWCEHRALYKAVLAWEGAPRQNSEGLNTGALAALC